MLVSFQYRVPCRLFMPFSTCVCHVQYAGTSNTYKSDFIHVMALCAVTFMLRDGMELNWNVRDGENDGRFRRDETRHTDYKWISVCGGLGAQNELGWYTHAVKSGNRGWPGWRDFSAYLNLTHLTGLGMERTWHQDKAFPKWHGTARSRTSYFESIWPAKYMRPSNI